MYTQKKGTCSIHVYTEQMYMCSIYVYAEKVYMLSLIHVYTEICTCCVRSKNTQKNMYMFSIHVYTGKMHMLCSIHVYTQKMHMSTDMFDPCTHTKSTCTPIVSKLNYSVLGVNHAVITGCTSLETSSTEAWLVGLSHAKPS